MVGSVVRLVAVLCVLAGLAGGAASAPSGSLALSVEVDADSPTPYVGEMILVKVKGHYDAFVALEHFEGIELPNFTWIQLGRDVWSKGWVDGREVTTVERKLALYPRKAGQLAIGPFHHVLTLDDGNGKRLVRDVVSNRVAMTVRAKPETDAGWWLPARDLTLDDHFDMDTAQLANGATATRTVTLTVHGQTADALPPPPMMRAPWLISFIAPEIRTTELTREGPVGTVTWQWRMRPSISAPGILPAFRIPWFDTDSRQMREAVLTSHRFAYAVIDEPTSAFRSVELVAWLIPLCLGLILPVVVVLPGRRRLPASAVRARLRSFLPERDRLALRMSLLAGDTRAYRRVAAKCLATRGFAPEAYLVPLDASLFGKGTQDSPSLRSIHRSLGPILSRRNGNRADDLEDSARR